MHASRWGAWYFAALRQPYCGRQNALGWPRTGRGRAALARETLKMSIGGMNQLNGSCDLHPIRNPPAERVLLNGMAQMIQARSTASQVAVVDMATARIDDSPGGQGAAVARLPDGYDRTDLRVLEWIAASRGRLTRTRMSELAA